MKVDDSAILAAGDANGWAPPAGPLELANKSARCVPFFWRKAVVARRQPKAKDGETAASPFQGCRVLD